jgi:hypothetical protein
MALAHRLDGRDHVGIVDLQPLGRFGAGGVERRGPARVQPFDGGQRPMGQRRLGGGGNHERRLAQRDHHLAALVLGAVPPQAEGLQPAVLLQDSHLLFGFPPVSRCAEA